MAKRPRTIDEYLAGLSADKRAALQRVRAVIQSAAPEAEECIAYGLPAFRLNGKCLVAFRAAANHCALHPMSGTTVAAHEAELAGYDTSTGTIRFQPSSPLPAGLIRKLVKTRIAENTRLRPPDQRRLEGAMATGTLGKSPDVAGRRERLVTLCHGLPEAMAERAGVQHVAFRVSKKTFAYYVYDHHGDGRIALLCKAAPGEQNHLVDEDPDRYFVPPYVGPRGWVGLRLDTPRVDWKAVKTLLSVAYVLTASDKLHKLAGQGKAARRGNPRPG